MNPMQYRTENCFYYKSYLLFGVNFIPIPTSNPSKQPDRPETGSLLVAEGNSCFLIVLRLNTAELWKVTHLTKKMWNTREWINDLFLCLPPV